MNASTRGPSGCAVLRFPGRSAHGIHRRTTGHQYLHPLEILEKVSRAAAAPSAHRSRSPPPRRRPGPDPSSLIGLAGNLSGQAVPPWNRNANTVDVTGPAGRPVPVLALRKTQKESTWPTSNAFPGR